MHDDQYQHGESTSGPQFGEARLNRPVHRFACPDLPEAIPELIEVTGDEAHHAVRVKRLGAGTAVEITDGLGRVVAGRIEDTRKLGKRMGWVVSVRAGSARIVDPVRPRVEVCSEPPKGPALESMIDLLSQVGVARWSPLVCERSEVDPRAGKLERLARATAEASKQCGRAWWLEIGHRVEFSDVLVGAADTEVVVAHASGDMYSPRGKPAPTVRIVVGPVGDLTAKEMEHARSAGATVSSFGPLILRIETAAALASGIVLDQHRRVGPP